MNLFKTIWFDMAFQYKYGFYLLYVLLTAFYICLINFLPENLKETAKIFFIYIDPVAIGFFFMGAIILLEKSQNIFSSLIVSPMSFMNYLIGKVVSLSIISTLSAFLIISFTIHNCNIVMLMTVFVATSIFTVLGMLGALYSDTLNKFILLSCLLALLFCVPGVFYLFGIFPKITAFHFAPAIIQGLQGNIISLLISVLWLIICLSICYPLMQRKYKILGGASLCKR